MVKKYPSLVIPIERSIKYGLGCSLEIRTNSERMEDKDFDSPLYMDGICNGYKDAFKVVYDILDKIDISKEEQVNAFKEGIERHLKLDK